MLGRRVLSPSRAVSESAGEGGGQAVGTEDGALKPDAYSP